MALLIVAVYTLLFYNARDMQFFFHNVQHKDFQDFENV